MSIAKPLLLAQTFENLKLLMKKVSQNVNTLIKVISKVKKTDGFLNVACRKCDTFVTDFQKIKDVFSKTMRFGGLRAEATPFGDGDPSVFWPYLPTRTLGCNELH